MLRSSQILQVPGTGTTCELSQAPRMQQRKMSGNKGGALYGGMHVYLNVCMHVYMHIRIFKASGSCIEFHNQHTAAETSDADGRCEAWTLLLALALLMHSHQVSNKPQFHTHDIRSNTVAHLRSGETRTTRTDGLAGRWSSFREVGPAHGGE